MSNLLNVSDEELQAELRRREAEKAEIQRRWAEEKKKVMHRLILDNIDALLAFTPEHRGTCNDGNHYNGDNCHRCMLFNIKRDQTVWPDNLEVSVELYIPHEGFSI